MTSLQGWVLGTRCSSAEAEEPEGTRSVPGACRGHFWGLGAHFRPLVEHPPQTSYNPQQARDMRAVSRGKGGTAQEALAEGKAGARGRAATPEPGSPPQPTLNASTTREPLGCTCRLTCQGLDGSEDPPLAPRPGQRVGPERPVSRAQNLLALPGPKP